MVLLLLLYFKPPFPPSFHVVIGPRKAYHFITYSQHAFVCVDLAAQKNCRNGQDFCVFYKRKWQHKNEVHRNRDLCFPKNKNGVITPSTPQKMSFMCTVFSIGFSHSSKDHLVLMAHQYFSSRALRRIYARKQELRSTYQVPDFSSEIASPSWSTVAVHSCYYYCGAVLGRYRRCCYEEHLPLTHGPQVFFCVRC